MSDSGLQEVLKTVFGGVDRMLIGKRFPQNVRALRLLITEEHLRSVVENTQCYDKLMATWPQRVGQRDCGWIT